MAYPASIKPPELNELSRPPILCKRVVLFKSIIMKLLSNKHARIKCHLNDILHIP